MTFAPGSGFFCHGGGEHRARLCFSSPPLADIRAGADRLTAAARRLLNAPTAAATTRGGRDDR